ncbi:MAG: cupredoxin domain-containing protein [Bacteroidota bacterium]
MKYMSIIILALSFLVLPACNDEDDTPPTYQIGMTNDSFVPAALTVEVGSTVTWFNNNSIAHTVTSATNLFDVNLEPGEEFSFVFPQAGTFEYECLYHPGMNGVIVVE